MAVEQDPSGWLPEPPPPRPAQRDAAIDAALRRFDGLPDAAAALGRAAALDPASPGLKRAQLDLFLSAGLVTEARFTLSDAAAEAPGAAGSASSGSINARTAPAALTGWPSLVLVLIRSLLVLGVTVHNVNGHM